MAVTFTPAAIRDAVRGARRTPDYAPDLLVLATSAVAIVAIALAYAGQTKRAQPTGIRPLVNLNEAPPASEIENRLGVVFAHPAERRFAARELAQYLAREREAGRTLRHVAAVGAVIVPAASIDRSPELDVLTGRLRAARARAEAARQAPPTEIRLLSPADVAALEPAFIVRTPERFTRTLVIYTALYILAFAAVIGLWRWRGVDGDRLLLAAAHLLTALGFAVLVGRQDALRDTMLFARFVAGIVVGLGLMAAVSLVDFRRAVFKDLSFVPLAGALTLSAVLVVFGSGPGGSSAKVNLGPVQPIEVIRLLLAFFLAGYFARRWELLRQDRRPVKPALGWLRLPPLDYVIPVAAGVAAALLFFFVQKDLGPALFLCCVFLAMYAVARGRFVLALTGLGVLVAGFYAGYVLDISSTLTARVGMWRSPWQNDVPGGDQVAQSLWGLATGGVFGTGLGLGDTRYLPAGYTDLPLAAVGEELGLIGLAAAGVVYVLLACRGFQIARQAGTGYGFFLAAAVTLFLAVPVLVMGAGALGVTPLTGVVTPFLSYGGSAMAANFTALGILAAIGSRPAADGPAVGALRAPVRHLGRVLAAAAAGLTIVLLDVQALRADRYAVKPHLGVQADGGRRYQYNRRILDAMRVLPRGTVYDRRGVVLATSSPAVIRAAGDRLEKLGVVLDASCVEPIERCYPMGGMTFHLLGDARTRANWGAANSSYVERDAENRLRGFDDRARSVRGVDDEGRSIVALRRDYSEVVPLLRHRYDTDDEAVRTLLDRNRDLTLSIDAGLQLRVTRIVSGYARRSKTGRAAAVVLDPATGEILALANYPWPSLGGQPAAPDDDSVLDRGRYGLYPPGSTFKLVTAAAALRRDAGLTRTTFGCTRLSDGRVGARLPGWGRPVRDDIRDEHPHGSIGMHDGLVRSCNAYFAQLAQHVGPNALLDTALQLGISMTSSNSPQRLRETLPQAGYGQGDVVASPLRMARVAAAIASDGALRDPYLIRPGAQEPPMPLLPPASARTLARYMRDAVLEGTGRSLARHPGRIAGKTGTAEVAGAPSHSWFVGFAPYGPATARIAFAVIIENAGYGGDAAAPAAGDIVSAALASGLIK